MFLPQFPLVLCKQLNLPNLSTSSNSHFGPLSKIPFRRNFNFTLLDNYIWLLNFLVNPSCTDIDKYCHIIIIYSFSEFFSTALTDGFHWSLRDSKSHQISRTLLSILADLNNAVVWIISTCPLISKCFTPLTNPLEISIPTRIGITANFTLNNVFSYLARSRCLSLFSFSFIFTLWATGIRKSIIQQVLFFVFCNR